MMALPARSSAGLNSEDDEPVLFLDPSLEDKVPHVTAVESTDEVIMATRAVALGSAYRLDRSSSIKIDQTNLEWQVFNGSLPNGAVSIYNGYAGRTDYVCKYGIEAGFYNPDMGPYCRYAYADKEHLGTPFEILVNKNNFEILKWKEGSYGSVPQNAVKTCSNKDTYVGKNKYGLGKVHVKNKAFFLPWEGYEYWYKTYQVLTFNRDIYSEHISDVKYDTDGVKIIEYPPEIMTKTTVDNNSNQPLTQTTTLSKTTQLEQRWDTSFSFTLGVKTSITAGIPEICSASIEFSAAATTQFSKGTTTTKTTSHSVSIQHKVPPNHSCTVSMVGYKYGADIPYTARLSRTYKNKETKWTVITGTYRGVQMGEVRSVVDPCEPLPIRLY